MYDGLQRYAAHIAEQDFGYARPRYVIVFVFYFPYDSAAAD